MLRLVMPTDMPRQVLFEFQYDVPVTTRIQRLAQEV